MAIVTLKGHVSRARDFYKKQEVFFGIGRTTPWDDESNPPTPKATDELEENVGFKLATSKLFVVPDPNGEIIYRTTRWKIVQEKDIFETGARWICVTANLAYDEISTSIIYRQVGIFTDVEREDNVPPGKEILLPNEIKNIGVLEVLDNKKPTYRDPDLKETLRAIIEF